MVDIYLIYLRLMREVVTRVWYGGVRKARMEQMYFISLTLRRYSSSHDPTTLKYLEG